MKVRVASVLLSAGLVACSDTAGVKSSTTSPDGGTGDAFTSGTALVVTVPAPGRTFVKLDPPSVIDAPNDPKTSLDWDLAFEGFDVFTNSGASGKGQGGSFGPFEAESFSDDDAPPVPFIPQDKTGGAFLDWYFYEGAPTHALWSRYHVFGVKDGEHLWKAQVLTYYGERDGASVAGLYKIRYAELVGNGWGPTTEIANLDGTAGGAQAPPTFPSECLDLTTGSSMMLTTTDARASSAWHLCFRRQTITVGGEMGGPRGVAAVDLDADHLSAETLPQMRGRTAQSEAPRFEAVTAADFTDQTFRGDRIVSGMGDAWLDRKSSPPATRPAMWLAIDATGQRKFFVGFTELQNATTTAAGTFVMHIKPVRG